MIRTKYNFILMRIGFFMFLVGCGLGFILHNSYLMLYLGLSGPLIHLLFCRCPKCGHDLFDIGMGPLKHIEFTLQLIGFMKFECPYCSIPENADKIYESNRIATLQNENTQLKQKMAVISRYLKKQKHPAANIPKPNDCNPKMVE
jgi:hypothetical protein